MKMSEERPPITANLILPILIKPILQKLERYNPHSAHTLRSAIAKAETTSPGLMFELVLSILRRADITVNVTESLLRLQGNSPEFEEYRIRRGEEPFQDLNKKSVALRKILARIPDEINDRKTFLETIKEIASAIKKLLDCVNEISNYSLTSSDKQVLENRKRDFIKYSKRFSTTLKEYFREGQSATVFMSAAHLIYQINLIQITVKNKCDIN
ncbi:programmed cell death protein 10-like isoform X2 [Leptotrombidium deliense]|uniref:Programmed cell death protein 10-like isoform X2 n=1 Tax=Leptotrombidium deliense TaxID=299467 RepID=A0A443SU63_9ACAR|nr:programmed cell death protein 10-like isoform X2 [Leptotrombidium deliense]